MLLSSGMLTIIGETTIILPADFNPKRPNYWEGTSILIWWEQMVLETVITGQTPNEKDALLAAAAQFSAS